MVYVNHERLDRAVARRCIEMAPAHDEAPAGANPRLTSRGKMETRIAPGCEDARAVV